MIPIKKQVTSLVKIKLVPGKNGRDLTEASLTREQETMGSGTGQCETTPAQERSLEAAHTSWRPHICNQVAQTGLANTAAALVPDPAVIRAADIGCETGLSGHQCIHPWQEGLGSKLRLVEGAHDLGHGCDPSGLRPPRRGATLRDRAQQGWNPYADCSARIRRWEMRPKDWRRPSYDGGGSGPTPTPRTTLGGAPASRWPGDKQTQCFKCSRPAFLPGYLKWSCFF